MDPREHDGVSSHCVGQEVTEDDNMHTWRAHALVCFDIPPSLLSVHSSVGEASGLGVGAIRSKSLFRIF